MIKLGQMVLRGDNWVHNDKIILCLSQTHLWPLPVQTQI